MLLFLIIFFVKRKPRYSYRSQPTVFFRDFLQPTDSNRSVIFDIVKIPPCDFIGLLLNMAFGNANAAN